MQNISRQRRKQDLDHTDSTSGQIVNVALLNADGRHLRTGNGPLHAKCIDSKKAYDRVWCIYVWWVFIE